MAKMNENITVRQAILGLATSILVMLIGNFILFGREDKKDYDKELKSKASIEYVNQQDAAIVKQVETQADQAKQREDLIIKWMESIDNRLSKIQHK